MARVLLALTLTLLQALRFEAVQPELFGLGGTFVNAWADYDADGDPDLFVGFDGAPNRLYRNSSASAAAGAAFEDVAKDVGVADARPTRAAAWGDFDADGDADLLLGFAAGPAGPVLRLYRNERASAGNAAGKAALSPAARFVDGTAEAGLVVAAGAVRQPAWIDYDGDSDLDLFVAFRDRANALFRNDAGKFTDIAGDIGLADTRRTVGAVWFDVEQDGDLDLAVANMDGDANGLFRNDKGRFTDIAESAGVMWGGRSASDKGNGTVRVCAADVDNDGRFDLFAANYGKNGLFLNQGGGVFKDASAAWGIDIDARYDSCAFEDFDHDGRVDFYVNGTVTGGVSYPDTLFRNVGGRFADVTPEGLKVLHADHGVQWADYDNDGDADLALTGAQPNGMHLLLANMLSAEDAARSLKVRVVDGLGRATLAGAEVRVLASGTRRLLAARLVDSGSGYDAQNDLPVHVGLPAAGRVDIEVTFPKGGTRLTMKQSSVDPQAWKGKVLRVALK